MDQAGLTIQRQSMGFARRLSAVALMAVSALACAGCVCNGPVQERASPDGRLVARTLETGCGQESRIHVDLTVAGTATEQRLLITKYARTVALEWTGQRHLRVVLVDMDESDARADVSQAPGAWQGTEVRYVLRRQDGPGDVLLR